MPQFLPLPDGSSLKLREGESPQAGWARAFESYPEAFGFEKPEAPVADKQGFMAGIRSGIENLKGDVGALGAGLGIEGGEAYARAQAAKAAQLYEQPKFSEAPVDYVTGMLGQSLPYMAAPLAAGAATLAAPLTGAAATIAGLGAAGAASAAQFTGSNLSRQLDEGRTTETLELGNAALAAIPQAALDTLSLKLLPGIGRIFGAAGKELTDDAAKAATRAVLARGTGNLVKQYGGAAVKTAGIEGLTETGQQVLERAQAELEMLDPEARSEYLDSFIGGAILGGTLAVPGKAFERGAQRSELAAADAQKAQAEAARVEQEAAAREQALIEAERGAPTASMPFVRSQQPALPGFDEVEQTQADAEGEAAPEKLMEQRQYMDRLLTDNQERMSAAAANADVNAIKTLQQQRSLIKADAAALDERLKATGFVDTAGQTQQLQQDIAKAQQQLQKMAGPGFDPDKAAKLIERIERSQAQLAEVGGPQQGLDLGAPRKLSDPVDSANKYYKENTKRTLDERQALLQQQQTLPDDAPDLFAEQELEIAADRLVKQYFSDQRLGFADSMLEKATAGTAPDVAVPEGVTLSERTQNIFERIETVDKALASVKDGETRQQLLEERTQLSGLASADKNANTVYDLRDQAEDALFDVEKLVDMLRNPEQRLQGTLYAEDAAPAKQVQEAKERYIRAVLQEAAAMRRIRGEKGVTLDEALKAADKINTELDELINRGQAVREVEEVITQPAQMRGTKIVSPAKTEMRDTRALEQRPFGKYRAALGTILDGVDKTRKALTAATPRTVQKKVPDFDMQFADREAQRVAEERGETATTLTGELRRRAEFVRNKMGRMQLTPQNVGKTWLATRNALNKAADAIDSGAVTRDLLDAVEPVVDAVLSRSEVKPVDLRAINDALKAGDATAVEQKEAGQKELFDTTTDRRRKDAEVGVIRQSAAAFNKVPAVVQARAAADKAREEAKKIQRVINQKSAAVRALQAIRRRIADLENKINATLERTKPAARSADSFFSLSKSFVKRLTPAELANATPERRAEYAAALQVEARYQAMRQEFDDKFKREGAASRAAVAPLQETKAVLDKQEKAFAKRISDLELALKDPALVAASRARAEAKDVLSGKAADLLAQVAEQRSDLQTAMDSTIAAIKPAFEAVLFATNPSVANAKKALDAAEASLDAAETALNKTKEQISSAGDVGGALRFALVYDAQRKAIEPARAALAPAREALEEAIAKAQVEYDKTALIAKAYQDGLVKVELAALNRLEKRLASVRKELGEASPEARAVQQEMAAQQKVLDIAEAKQREARELAAKQQSQYDDRMQKGFGLPFTRRVEGAVVKSSSEADAETKKIQERFDRYFESWSRAQSKADRTQSEKAARKSKRAIGPAARSQSAAPSAMRTGSAESREGQGRTQSDMRVTEVRGEKQTDVAVSSKEMSEANRIADELRNKSKKEREKEAREAQAVAKELLKSQRKEINTDFDDEFASVVRNSDYDARPTTDLPTTVKADVRAGRLEDALLRLQDEGSTPFVRELAKRVAPYLKGVTLVSNTNVVDSNGVPVEGLYVGKDMQVQISSTTGLTEEAFLHEVVHPATLTLLRAAPATLTPEQRQARQDLESLFAQVQADPHFKREYAKFSVAEMVSEVMSNNKLRNMLDQRGFLQRMYDGFLRLLGFSPKAVSAQAVENIYALFAPAQPIADVKVASVMRGIFPGTNPVSAPNTPDAVQKVVDNLVAKPASIADKIMANVAGLAFRTQFIDRFAPIETLLRKGVERGLIPAMQSFQTQYFLRFGEQRNQFLQQSASDGVVQLVRAKDGSFTIEGTSGANLANIAKELRSAELGNEQNVEALFTTYLAGIRAKQDGVGIEKLNFENKITQADLDAVNRYIDANPKAKAAFEKARKEYGEYNKNLLKFLADSGAISREEAARLSAKEYVPYYREDANGVVNLIVGSEKPVRIGNIVDQPYLKELVGGNDKILPFFAGAMQNTSLLLDMALRNLQTKDVAHTMRKLGAAQLGNGQGPSGKNVVHFKEHGEPRFAIIESDTFGVPAELLVQGMQGIKTSVPAAIQLLSIPADILRKFVTRNPAYAVRQSIRDPLNAWLTTGGNFTPILSSFKELGSMVAGRSPNEQILQQAGAISSNVFSGGADDLQRILRDISGGKGGYDRLMSKADAFAMQGDAATRAVLYNTYREKGMTHMQALLGSLESMNFARRGISPTMQFMSMMVPFFNAQIQGLDVIYRAATGKSTFEGEMKVREQLLKRGLIMAAGTMAYAALMQDDEAYKNATPEERAQNWFVYLPGMDEPIRVPIPFELGLAFKAIPEMVFNTAFGDEKLSDAAKTIGKLAYNTVPIGMPQGIKPLVEVATNYSFFAGDSIVSQREQGLDPAEQFRANTSELAKTLGAYGPLSPIQIEYLIRGYTGGLGVALTQLANPVLRPLSPSDMPEGPAKKVSQMPIIGNLFQPTDGRGIINAAYEQADEFQQASNTFKKMLEQGRRADAQAYAQRYSAELAGNALGGAFRQQMGELSKVRRMIETSTSLTPEQKRVRVDGIRQIELKLAQRIREYDKTKPQ